MRKANQRNSSFSKIKREEKMAAVSLDKNTNTITIRSNDNNDPVVKQIGGRKKRTFSSQRSQKK
jgi:hypothetical protein